MAWPVSGGSWTQGAEEGFDVLGGYVDITYPATCDGVIGPGSGNVTVKFGDATVATLVRNWDATKANSTERLRVPAQASGFASTGTPTARELTVRVSDGCNGSPNFTFDDLRLEVGGFR